MKNLLIMLFAATFLLAACGEKKEMDDMSGEMPQQEETNTSNDSDMADATTEIKEVVIEGNDMMKFNLDNITAEPGQKIKLTLKHVGKMPVQAMGHNWVLLKQDVEISANSDFIMAAIKAGIDNGHIPEAMSDKIIAHTELIGGGEVTSIEFTAPEEPGTYKYVCTFPGHWGQMQGDFVVQ